MPLQYVSVHQTDLARGIDSRSQPNQLQDGFSEDLLNVDTSSQGFLSKRKGYQGVGGYLPLRVISVTRTTNQLTFGFDSSMDLSDLTSGPIYVYGKLSAEQTGDFSDTTTEAYYTTFSASTSSITVTDSASGSYTDTAPQLCVYGLRPSEITASGSAPRWVTSLSTYRRESQEQLVATLGGTPFYLETSPSGAQKVVTCTTTTTGGSVDIAPAFWSSAVNPSRTRGYIRGDNTVGNYAVVDSAVYNSGTGFTDYVLRFDNIDLNGSLSTIISSDTGREDYLVVTDMNNTRLNGRFKIRATSQSGDEITVSVEDAIDASVYDEADAGGRAGIFMDRLQGSGTFTLEVGDRILAAPFDAESDIITIDSRTTNNITVDGVIEQYTVANGTQLTGVRTSDTITVANTTNWVPGDMITVQSAVSEYANQIRVLSLTTTTVTLDQDITVTHSDGLTLAGRWLPIEIPEATQDLRATTKTTVFDANDYSEQPRINTASISDSLYFTNGQDEVYKYDGSSIYRAGLIKWNPTISFVFNTRPEPVSIQAGPAVSWTSSTLAGSTRHVTVSGGALAGHPALEIGDRLIGEDAGNRVAVVGKTDDSLTIAGEIADMGGSQFARKLVSYKYYFRLNAIDANNNRIVSATTAANDCVVDVIGADKDAGNIDGGQIQIRLAGIPDFGIYDWDRLELEVYKTAADTVAPFYLLTTRQLPADVAEGYITIVDNTADPTIVPTYDEETVAMAGPELGPAWDQPPLAKYTAAVNNHLVLAHTKDYPEASITYRPRNDLEETKGFNAAHLTFTRTDAVVPGITDMVNQVSYQNVQGEFLSADSTALGMTIDAATDLITISSAEHIGNFYHGQAVRFASSGTMPAPLQAGQTYYVRSVPLGSLALPGTFRLSTVPFGPTLDITSAGTGTVTLYVDAGEGRAATKIWINQRVTFTNSSATISVDDVPAASFTVGDEIQLRTTGTLPTNFAVDTRYYVVSIAPLQVSATVGGSAIVAGSAGSGTHVMDFYSKFDLHSASSVTTSIPGIVTSWDSAGYNFSAGAEAQWAYLFTRFRYDLGDEYLESGFTFPFQSELNGWYQKSKVGSNIATFHTKAFKSGSGILRTFLTAAVNTTDDTITITNHKFQNGDRVRFFAESGTITGISEATDYYVSRVDRDTIKLWTSATFAAFANPSATTAGTWAVVGYPYSNPMYGTNRILVSKNTLDVPVYAFPRDNSDWRWWYSGIASGESSLAPKEQRDQYWSLRFMAAINGTMRSCQQTSFTPWLAAYAGSDQGVNTLVVRRPFVEEGLPQVEVTSIDDTAADIFVNGVRRNEEDIVSFEQKLFPSRCVVSYKNYPEVFDDPNNTTGLSDSVMDINAADGQEITGLASFLGESSFGAAQLSDVLVVFKTASIYVCDLSDSTSGGSSLVASRTVRKLDTNGMGCTVPGSIASTRKGIVFANNSGIYVLNRDLSISYLGRYMEGYWKDVNKDNLLLPIGMHDPQRRRYMLSLPMDEDTQNADVFVYDYTREEFATDLTPGGNPTGYASGAWTRYDNIPATAWTTTTENAYFGTQDGQIYSLRQAGDTTDYRDDAAAVGGDDSEMRIRYKATDFGEGDAKKVLAAVVTQFAAESDMEGTTLEIALDLTENFQEAADYQIDRNEEVTNFDDENQKRVQTVRATPSTRRGVFFQPQYRNSTKDEAVVIAGMDYVVAGLPLRKGLRESDDGNGAL